MIRDFEVQGFKKFSSLRLDNLGQINILLGRNNVGKTTMLEALFAHACGGNVPRLLLKSIIRRSSTLTGVYDFAEKLLNGFHDKKNVSLTFSTKGTDEQNEEHFFDHFLVAGSIFSKLLPEVSASNAAEMQWMQFIQGTKDQGNVLSRSMIGFWETNITEQGMKMQRTVPIFYPNFIEDNYDSNWGNFLNCKFVDILSHRDENENRNIYALLKRENLLTNFVSEMSKTFGEVQGIDMLPYPDGTNGPVSVATDRGFIPLSNFGDGLQRYFHVMGGLYLYRNGIHCIEEVDATFHPEAQESFSKGLLHYSEITNNQVFMSSHNAEFVDNFLRTVSSSLGEAGLEKIRVITMKDTKDSQVRVRTLTGTEALIRRNEYEMELR